MKKITKNFMKAHFGDYISLILFALLLISLLLTRGVMPETKSPFGYDQVDNAWAAKNIIVDHKFPLTGMQAKGNTGFYIGPYYYYFVSIFYFLTNLNPIASNLASITVSIFSFIVIYFVTKEIFNKKVALIALFINTFSSYIIESERTQWPVNFVVPISFLVIFSIYKICQGKTNYLYLLAFMFGLSMHLHFTFVFYIPLILLMTPFFPRKRETIMKGLFSLLILLLFLWPVIINLYSTNNGTNAANYLGSSFHGFHLRRFLQITGDGLIEFNSILGFAYSLYASFFLFIVYMYFLFKSKIKSKLVIITISLIWVLIPWLILSTYSGELTNYYFSVNRPIALLAFSYVMFRIYESRNKLILLLVILIGLIYGFLNLVNFFNKGPVGLKIHKEKLLKRIEEGEKIEFVQGDPQSYLYYYQQNNKK